MNRRIDEAAAALAASWPAGVQGAGPGGFRAHRPGEHQGGLPPQNRGHPGRVGLDRRHCQLVTFRFGPWVRLGTVFTDLELPCGPPVTRHFCGRCRRCIEACPAGALSGAAWEPGLSREIILDAGACDRYKKEHFLHLHQGHNCGICAAACPFGQKTLQAG